VKLRGFRVELGEIETRLAEQPLMKDVVVVAREDRPGDKRLVAYYTLLEPGRAAEVDVDELRRRLSSVLPEYMVPAAYVRLDTIPLNANGKLDRKALPAPERADFGPREYEAPIGEVESALARIWSEVLRVQRVGRRDNFFALGGHSLLAISVMERMQREELYADVRSLFAAPNLMELAAMTGRATEVIL